MTTPKLRVLLVANYALDHQLSMQRFAEAVRSGLAAEGCTMSVVAPMPVLFAGATRSDGIWKWIGYINKYLIFPLTLRRAVRSTDLVHICDHANAVYVWALGNRPHIVTCHDVIAIRVGLRRDDAWRMGITGRLLQRWILRGLRRAQRIVCVSDYTRDQLLELAPELSARTSVVNNGLNCPFFPVMPGDRAATLAAAGMADRPYFLHVGSALPRKNRAHVVRVFAELRKLQPTLPHRLVFVGAPLAADIGPLIGELGLKDDVLALGVVSNETLRDLYSGATALIFPSLAEGFGWPVIEAQACGCPAFITDRRPLTDIGGPAALRLDAEDPCAAAAVIARALPNIDRLRQPSLANAARFSTERMIGGYAGAYAEALAASELARSDAGTN